MSKCDCDDCGGVKDCGCAAPVESSAGSCGGGACSITSQSTAMHRSGTTIHPAAARAFRGTQLSAYDIPTMNVGPRAMPAQHTMLAGYGGPMPSSGLALVSAAGQTAPAPITVPTPPPPYKPGMGGAQQPQSGVSPEVAQALLNFGTVGLQGLQAIFTTAFTQANETDRARIASETQRQIAQLQREGLLSQQEATNAMIASANAQHAASPPPPPPPPAGWWASMTQNQKLAVGVGATVGVVGIGALIYKATR